MKLLDAMRDFFREHGNEKKYYVAYSGGLDSQVLLSLCHQVQSESHFSLSAIHINHGLSANAHTWAQHCKKTCEQLSIPYVEQSLQLQKENGESLEALAREKRYAVFEK